jgi:hypothetical protein
MSQFYRSMLSNNSTSVIVTWMKVWSTMNLSFAIFLWLFGVMGNALNILVLSQRALRSNSCAWLFLISSLFNLVSIIRSDKSNSVPLASGYHRQHPMALSTSCFHASRFSYDRLVASHVSHLGSLASLIARCSLSTQEYIEKCSTWYNHDYSSRESSLFAGILLPSSQSNECTHEVLHRNDAMSNPSRSNLFLSHYCLAVGSHRVIRLSNHV